jgi:hypothetical protein
MSFSFSLKPQGIYSEGNTIFCVYKRFSSSFIVVDTEWLSCLIPMSHVSNCYERHSQMPFLLSVHIFACQQLRLSCQTFPMTNLVECFDGMCRFHFSCSWLIAYSINVTDFRCTPETNFISETEKLLKVVVLYKDFNQFSDCVKCSNTFASCRISGVFSYSSETPFQNSLIWSFLAKNQRLVSGNVKLKAFVQEKREELCVILVVCVVIIIG